MNDDELTDLFNVLSETVRSRGLGWLVDEVNVAIATGIEAAESADEPDQSKRGELRSTRRDYEPLERVDLLLEGVGRVVQNVAAIEDSIESFFEEERTHGEAPSEVSFLSEPNSVNGQVTGFQLSGRSESTPRLSTAATVSAEIERVRREIRS